MTAKIIEKQFLAADIFTLKLETFGAKPGQFHMFYVDGAFLPRPISVCETDDTGTLFAIQTVGEGTKRLAATQIGGELNISEPLGNGFPIDEIRALGKVALVGGGIGTAPLIELAKRLDPLQTHSFCGFSTERYLTEKLPNAKYQIGGYVTDLFDAADYNAVVACGNDAFSNAVIKKCRAANTELYISLDRRMACGIGACLCCACETRYGYKRCCADGPVFKGSDLL